MGNKDVVKAEVCQPWNQPRLACNDFLEGQATNAAIAVDLMSRKCGLYTQMEKTWKLEHAIAAALAKGGGATCLQAKVMECLPSETNAISMKSSKELLAALSATPFYNYCTVDAQQVVALTTDTINGLMKGQAPSAALLSSSPSMQAVADRLPFFVRLEEQASASDGGGKVVHTGKDALAGKLSAAVSLHEKDSNAVTAETMDEFEAFYYLLDADQQKKVTKLSEDVSKRIVAGPKKRKAAPAFDTREA